jgi:hypothetical protein
MIINTAVKDIEELMNIIIAKAVNCRKISIKFISTSYPNISIYEKGL